MKGGPHHLSWTIKITFKYFANNNDAEASPFWGQHKDDQPLSIVLTFSLFLLCKTCNHYLQLIITTIITNTLVVIIMQRSKAPPVRARMLQASTKMACHLAQPFFKWYLAEQKYTQITKYLDPICKAFVYYVPYTTDYRDSMTPNCSNV